MKFFLKSAFTLAEVMITLTVIGIIAAVIIPVAIHSTPDESVLKFKKGHDTLYKVISTLVNSDKYYLDGDLGIDSEGNQLYDDYATNAVTTKYFCKTFADVVSAKSVNCSVATGKSSITINGQTLGSSYTAADVTESTLQSAKENLDTYCKKYAINRGQEIVLADGAVFYKAGTTAFGSKAAYNDDGTTTILRFFSPPGQFPANYGDTQGFDVVYMTVCLDIDGFDESTGSSSCDDVNDICPFGYGIRADGKILAGNRAEAWLNKSIQGDE